MTISFLGNLMKLKSKRGQGLVEYALILSLIALVCIGALAGFGQKVDEIWTEYSTAIGNAIDRSTN